ncbi:hypothetical protein THRCLA_22731 [Thraustotheca clavata]|uniref:Uncharacterized protein n=1 Tax=Thraustotheca clavata TaxID=74557 RepID=A0A1V9YTN4_9STRA|nr:hypothetical protein THRCLA_22731 [Thraustotheca clavata]
MASLTFDVIGLAAFGYNFDNQSGLSKDIADAFERLDTLPHPLFLFGMAYIPGFERLPLSALKRREEAKNILYKVVYDVISQKLALPPVNS